MVPEYLAAGHSLHDTVPLSDGAEYCPRRQSVQLDAPINSPNFPVGQSAHVAMLVAAVVTENVPASQFMQAVDPLYTEYVPALQAMQSELCVAPETLECVPAGQSRHTEAPVMFKNFPALHGVHAVAPVAEAYVPAPQNLHAPLPPALLPVVLYCPATHAGGSGQ